MDSLSPIELTADPEAWRLFSVRKADKNFASFSQQVFDRDQYTCRFCGFCGKHFQEVINLDGNYYNNKLPNLVTACCFCAQCFFLGAVGRGDYGGGVLIYLPELGQGALNCFCHVLFCAMANATNYRVDAQNMYRGIKLRSELVEKQLGEGMSDPVALSRTLIDVPISNKIAIKKQIFSSLKLLPSYTKFVKQVEILSEESFKELSE
jgi:intracellular multiplication protein IcmJ